MRVLSFDADALCPDLWSPYFCGEGVPDFVVDRTSKPFVPFPLPNLKPLPLDPHGYPELQACIKVPYWSRW